nr:unnamed protein product [Digitaria exilis]
MIKVPPEVKAAALASFRSCGGQLSDGNATLHRWCSHDLSWACHGDEVTTTTDVLLVWHIATGLFEISMVIAQSLSRYCTYLVVEAPDLLPDDSTWTKRRYKAVKKHIEEAFKSSHAVPEYGHLIDSFGTESSHEVLKKGSRLAKQLVEEAAGAGGEDAVWEHLAKFWSEMVLYLAPSDNVKAHIQALQRGGEFITHLWALLLHAGIINRPTRHFSEP